MRRRRGATGIWPVVFAIFALLRRGIATLAKVARDPNAEPEPWDAVLPDALSTFPGLPKNKHPSIVIIGVAKSGTTGLQAQIAYTWESDFVNRPAQKELHVLNSRKCKDGCRSSYLRQLNSTGGLTFTIDASPGYVHGGPRTISNLQANNPEAGIILLMREPIARALSMFNYMTRQAEEPYGPSSRTFAELATFEMDLFDRPPLKEAIDQLLSPTIEPMRAVKILGLAHHEIKLRSHEAGFDSYRLYSPLLGSIYIADLIAWREYLSQAPATALLVDSEYFFTDMLAFSRKVIHPYMMGGPNAPGRSSEERDRIDGLQERWKDRSPKTQHEYSPQSALPPDVGCRLQRFYAPFVARLLELLPVVMAANSKVIAVPALEDPRSWWKQVDYCSQSA